MKFTNRPTFHGTLIGTLRPKKPYKSPFIANNFKLRTNRENGNSLFWKRTGVTQLVNTCTCGLYHPKGYLNIFMGLLSFFRPFRYGKNDLSRSRGILSPGAPIVSMVVYVVVKIRSQIDGFGLIGSGWFFIKISGQPMWSLLAASAHQGRCIVPLLQPFVKSVCD